MDFAACYMSQPAPNAINDINDPWFKNYLSIAGLTPHELIDKCNFSYDGYIYISDVLHLAGVKHPANVWKCIKNNVASSINVIVYARGDYCSFCDLILIFISINLPQFNKLREIIVSITMTDKLDTEHIQLNKRLSYVIKTLKRHGEDRMKTIVSLNAEIVSLKAETVELKAESKQLNAEIAALKDETEYLKKECYYTR
jgi:FtsZ-binding cell division protein ZapB